MIKFLERLLGIELIQKNMEELSQDDVKVMNRVRDLEKDVRDLLVYLNVERKEEWKEEWKEDKRFTPSQPVLITSKWTKKKK